MSIELRLFFILAIIIITTCICIWIYDLNHFVMPYYKLSDKRIKKDFRFVFLSDLHSKTYGNGNEKIIETIKNINPNAVLIGGDMMVAKSGNTTKIASDLIIELAKTYQVYYANGNHELRIRIYEENYKDMYEEYESTIKVNRVARLLNDTIFLPEHNITITGLDLKRKYYKRFKKRPMRSDYLNYKLGDRAEESYSILLAHNPDYFEEYADYGSDLILAGHIHGGVADLPFVGGVVSPALHFFPKYDGGLFIKKKSIMLLSRGLGVHTIPVRFLNPGELIVVDLKKGT